MAVLRNPVDMIASLHAHKLGAGTEDLPDLEDALAAEDDRHAGRHIPRDSNPMLATYRDRARYGEQIPRWLDAVGREQVHVILFEEMVRDPESHFQGLLEFLGVDRSYRPPTFAAYNQAHSGRGSLVRRIALTRPAQLLAWRVLPALIGDGRTRALSRRLGHSLLRRRPVTPAEVPAELRARLEAEFAPDVARLSEVLGRDVAAVWFDAHEAKGTQRSEAVAVSGAAVYASGSPGCPARARRPLRSAWCRCSRSAAARSPSSTATSSEPTCRAAWDSAARTAMKTCAVLASSPPR